MSLLPQRPPGGILPILAGPNGTCYYCHAPNPKWLKADDPPKGSAGVFFCGNICPKLPQKVKAGRKARAKGQRGEREFATRLRDLYPDAHRGAQSRSGRDGSDVEGTPWWVECKTLARISAFRHLDQAERDTDGRPVLVRLREDGDTRGAVLLREDVFLDLLRQAGGRI